MAMADSNGTADDDDCVRRLLGDDGTTTRRLTMKMATTRWTATERTMERAMKIDKIMPEWDVKDVAVGMMPWRAGYGTRRRVVRSEGCQV